MDRFLIVALLLGGVLAGRLFWRLAVPKMTRTRRVLLTACFLATGVTLFIVLWRLEETVAACATALMFAGYVLMAICGDDQIVRAKQEWNDRPDGPLAPSGGGDRSP
jgi:hypothetical protein